MNTDILDPAEQAEAALLRVPDTGAMGHVPNFAGKILNACSLHHYEAYGRLTFQDISVRESAILFVYLLTKSGREASALRTEKQLNDFRFDAMEWGMKVGAPNPVVIREMMTVKDACLKDIEQAESVAPKPEGASAGNA
jgi:hypothetical protein